MSKLNNLILYEDLDNKISVIYDYRTKNYYIYGLLIPKNLANSLKVNKATILRYHTDPHLIKKGRGEPNEDKFKRIVKEFMK